MLSGFGQMQLPLLANDTISLKLYGSTDADVPAVITISAGQLFDATTVGTPSLNNGGTLSVVLLQ
jgi:hypothetical protein